MVQCPALPTLKQWQSKLEKDGTITLKNFTIIYGELQGQYIECAIRNDCLIEAVQGTKETAKSPKCEPRSTKEGKANEPTRK